MGAVEVTVALTHDIEAGEWARRHAVGEVPDRAPYGMDRLCRHGVIPRFRAPMRSPAARWAAARVRNRALGLELGAAGRYAGNAVLCMDERTGLPAAMTPGGPPVLTRIVWLTTGDGMPRWYRTLARTALPRAAGVWTNVSSMVPILAREWGLRDVHLVPLGIDADFFAEQAWDTAAGLVVSAGEDRMRDHELLVAAVAAARRRVPHRAPRTGHHPPRRGGPDAGHRARGADERAYARALRARHRGSAGVAPRRRWDPG